MALGLESRTTNSSEGRGAIVPDDGANILPLYEGPTRNPVHEAEERLSAASLCCLAEAS